MKGHSMSGILQDIQVDLFLPELKASSQKQIFQMLAKEPTLRSICPQEDILSRLSAQEKINPSAIGDGVALLHLQLKYLYKPYKILATLKKPVAFQTPDAKPVDLVCLVLSPEHDGPPLHLRHLARMSRVLKNADLRRQIREAKDLHSIRSLLSTSERVMLAA
jgi:PTS system nitrogen regulatory IIA component